jgi:hypothetical protein
MDSQATTGTRNGPKPDGRPGPRPRRHYERWKARLPLVNSLQRRSNLATAHLGPLARPAGRRPITVVPLKLKLGREEQHQPPAVRRPRAVRLGGGVQERGGHPPSHAESRTPCVADHMREPSRPANPDHLPQDPALHRPAVQDGPPHQSSTRQQLGRRRQPDSPAEPGWGHQGGRLCQPPLLEPPTRRRSHGRAGGAGRQRRTRPP